MLVSGNSRTGALWLGCPYRTKEVHGVNTRVTARLLDNAARTQEACTAGSPGGVSTLLLT